jgi:hypothetical protein
MNISDPAKSAQADSPYYDVVAPAPASGFEQTHSVIKKHHVGVEKEGEISFRWLSHSLPLFQDSPCSCMRMAASVPSHSLPNIIREQNSKKQVQICCFLFDMNQSLP